jgi:hypothetical protein
MISEGTTTISKKAALKIVSKAFQTGITEKENNVINGFASHGPFPVAYPQIKRRWHVFHDDEIQKQLLAPSWIKARAQDRNSNSALYAK